MKGSITVEAALVFPFCFLVIAILCCLGIFQYNQAVLKLTGYECVIHGADSFDEADQKIRENIQRNARQRAQERLLGVTELEASVKVTASKILVIYSGRQSLLNLPLKADAVYERVYPELTLRLLSGSGRE